MDEQQRGRMIAQTMVAMDRHWGRPTDPDVLAQAQGQVRTVEDDLRPLLGPPSSTAGEADDPYDNVTLGALRARLRSLNVPQLQQLATYEKHHANREPVLQMLAYRIHDLQRGAEPEGATTDEQFEDIVQALRITALS